MAIKQTTHLYDDFVRYDEILTDFYARNPGITDLLSDLLNGYSGMCLDVGCGTGIHGPLIEKTGLEVTGVDISQLQLQIATEKNRLSHVIQASAVNLPFKEATFDVIVSCYTHTDFDDWQAALREIARVLKLDGTFVYVGPHPCFFGAHAERQASGNIQLHPGYYWNEKRIFKAPGFSAGGVREKVGEKHLSLAALLDGFSDAGLHIERINEDRSSRLPMSIGVRASRKVM